MRTTSIRTASMFGGMRGQRSSELQVIAPPSTLTSVTLVNLARLTVVGARAAGKHPLTSTAVVLVGILYVWLGVIGVMTVLVVAVVALVVWRRWASDSYRRVVVSRWRRVWTYGRWWQPAMVTCGLAQELNGREYLPRIRKVIANECVDQVLIDLLSGQSPEDFERHTLQLAHTFAVRRVHVTVAKPGRIWLEFTHHDALADTIPSYSNTATAGTDPGTETGLRKDAAGAGGRARPSGSQEPSAVDLTALPIGKCEDGSPWRLRLLGSHLLVAGATGSGKGSVLWSLIRAVGPCIRDGMVQVWAIDPKGGMELTPGAGLFTRFAYDDPASMVELLEEAVASMRARTERLRVTGHRVHIPTPGDPLILVLVDEMAALTAYVGDRDLKKRAETALQLLLTQGRAPGVLVAAAVQDPGKDVLPFRDLFPFRIALRLLEDVQVDMVLGRSARLHGAECDLIPASLPGIGYVIQEGVREPVRVRAGYVSDDDLAQMVHDYAPRTAPEPQTTSEPALQLVAES